MTLPTQLSSLKSSCLQAVVTQGELSCLVPSPLPELPSPLDTELELITITGTGPVKIARIEWTWPLAPRIDSQEFAEFSDIVGWVGDSDRYGTDGAEVLRLEPGIWQFLNHIWRLGGRCQDADSPPYFLNAVIEKSSIVHFNPINNYFCALRFFKKHVVTEVSGPFGSNTEVAVYDKIEAIQQPEVEDTVDWMDEDKEERWRKIGVKMEMVFKAEDLMVKEEMAVEDGWAALPFAPELLPLSTGVFLASSVEYSWPGFIPGEDGERHRELFLYVPKMVKLVKEEKTWQLSEFWMDSETLQFGGDFLLNGEGDSVVRWGMTSMRILATGQLLLTRKSVNSGLEYGGPDFRGASYTLYSHI